MAENHNNWGLMEMKYVMTLERPERVTINDLHELMNFFSTRQAKVMNVIRSRDNDPLAENID